jgi:hypothetical protein
MNNIEEKIKYTIQSVVKNNIYFMLCQQSSTRIKHQIMERIMDKNIDQLESRVWVEVGYYLKKEL